MASSSPARNIVLVVDAACDLPQTFLKERNIVLLPTSINVNGTIYTDDKDPLKLEHFYQQGLLTKKNKAESIAYSAEQISQLVRDKLVPNYDCIIVQTVSQKKKSDLRPRSTGKPFDTAIRSDMAYSAKERDAFHLPHPEQRHPVLRPGRAGGLYHGPDRAGQVKSGSPPALTRHV